MWCNGQTLVKKWESKQGIYWTLLHAEKTSTETFHGQSDMIQIWLFCFPYSSGSFHFFFFFFCEIKTLKWEQQKTLHHIETISWVLLKSFPDSFSCDIQHMLNGTSQLEFLFLILYKFKKHTFLLKGIHPRFPNTSRFFSGITGVNNLFT